MIQMTLSTAFMLYLGGTLSTLFLLWVIHTVRLRFQDPLPFERKLFQCEYCQADYLEESSRSVTQCPRCQSFNR